MLPRISSLISKKNHDEVVRLFSISLELIIAFGTAIAFGIAAISDEFIPFFFGNDFNECIILTYGFAPVIIIKGIVNTIRMQYLIPYDRNRDFCYSVCLGAIINIVLNLIYIPRYAALGAVIGTLGAESVSCLYQLFNIRNIYKINWLFRVLFIYNAIGLCMFLSIRVLVNHLVSTSAMFTIINEVLIGGFIYCVLIYIYWKKTDNKMIHILFPKAF